MHQTSIQTDSGTNRKVEDPDETVRDKRSERLERRRRMGKKNSVGVQALLNVPADGQTWAFSY